RKTEIRMTVPRFAVFDDFKQHVSDPRETSMPRHLLVTKRFEEYFEELGLSKQQRQEFDRLVLAHRRSVQALRERVGIDKAMVKLRDEVFSKGRSKGLVNRDLWAFVQTEAHFSDQQTEAFRVTLEWHDQFKSEAMHLLTQSQRSRFRSLKKRKKDSK
ncbi:MAG: hypothetical protein AAF664_24235, partial [Planctomycetota bacterium]